MHTEQVIQGRLVGPKDAALIQSWLAAHPSGHRTQLSRELCLQWDWRNGAG